jgi:UDP-GlcNAc:undecaprenyl-phosphate/decaprenyl-phosphate GlcNAc-1-phosphate transferase
MGYILVFATACAITFLVSPIVRFFALKFSILDRKGERSVHNRVITRFGGLGIYAGFVFAMLLAYVMRDTRSMPNFNPLLLVMMAATLMLVLGVYDDAKSGVNPVVKFGAQILAALLLINAGFVIRRIGSPFGGMIDLGLLSVPVTVLWLVGITNAINLIDGLDGLAVGIVLICSLGMFFSFIFLGFFPAAFFAIALAGACLGFLRYNFYPATMFMGDTGSLFLGFSLASLALFTSYKTVASIGLLVPIIGLAIPIADTSMAFIRRLATKKNPFTPDKKHIHHWLLEHNISHKKAVYIIWGITILLNIIACSLFLI